MDLDSQTYKQEDFDLAYFNFDFTKSYEGKNEDNYQFGTTGAYINIQVADGEIYKLNTRVSGEDINLYVVDYGTDIAKLGLVNNLENLTPAA